LTKQHQAQRYLLDKVASTNNGNAFSHGIRCIFR